MKKITNGNDPIPYSDDIQKFVAGAGINLGGFFLGKGIVFVNTLILARLLTASELGIFFLGLSITMVSSMLALMGLRIGTIRFISVYDAKGDSDSVRDTVLTAAGITFACALLIASVLFVIRKWLAVSVFGKPELSLVLEIFLFAIPFETTCKIFLAATQGLKLMHYTVYVEQMLALFLRLIFISVLVGVMDMGIRGAALAYVISAFGSMVVAFVFCNHEIHFLEKGYHPKFRAKKLLRFSFPLLLTTVIFTVSKEVDILLLGCLASPAAVGIYTVAARLIGFSEIVFRAFQNILNPFISELCAKKAYSEIGKLFYLASKWSVTLSLPLFLIFLLFPSFVMSVFSHEISTGAGCLAILACVHMFTSPSALGSSMIFMSGRSGVVLVNNIFFIISNVSLNYVLIPAYGVLGAASAHALSMFLLAIARFAEVFKIMNMHPFHLSLLKPLAASVLSALPLFAYFGLDPKISWSALISSFTLFCLLYVIFILLFKFDEDDQHAAEFIKARVSKILCALKERLNKTMPDTR